MENKMPRDVLIVQDTCDGEYEDLIGKVVQVVEVDDTGDPDYQCYTVITDRPSKNPYMEGKFEDIVMSCDVEILNYHDF